MISPMLSPIASPLSSPPQRPNRSRLRTVSTIDQFSSSHSSNPSINSNSLSDIISQDSAISTSSSTSRRRAEKDEFLDEIINEFTLPPLNNPRSILRTDSLKTSKSLNSITEPCHVEFNLPIKPTPSTSTPPLKKQSLARKYSSNGSILSTTPGHTKHHLAPGSLNRADLIISRLEEWHVFLKSIIGWLEETCKINMISSRGYSQRAYSHLDESHEKKNQFVRAVQAGLYGITMQLAAEQQEMAHTIERQYLPELNKLRKEVKDKINKYKNDPALVLDDLLRRAEVTRAKMTVLNRSCKQVDQTDGQVDMDPWLANSVVLYHLKREVEEENRLRMLLIPIQKDAYEFEQRVTSAVKPAIEYCYQKVGSSATPFQLLMDQVSSVGDWEQFVELNKRDLVDEKVPKKDYLKINYPNKFHSAVKMLFKGKLQRKLGTRKQFLERHYVLTRGGYLHEFPLENSVTPERTFYIPSTTIIPSVDINHLDQEETDLTFEICRPSTNILQKDKVTIFKASSTQDLLDWCRLLIQVSTGIPISPQIDTPKVSFSPILEDNESGVIDDYFSKS